MTCAQLEHAETIQRIRDDYLRTLVAPMDGMWERAIIAHAAWWEIQDHEQHAGHFCIDSNNYLLRFHLVEQYRARAQELFRWILATYGIEHAIASTIEPLYFSVCLDVQQSMTPHSYLFRDSKRIEFASGSNESSLRKAAQSEFDDLVHFYRANTKGSGDWIEGFLQKRLDRDELYVLHDRQTLVATGECIPSQQQPPYADLGMVVDQSHRGRGLGSFMLVQLKQRCYEAGWKPICSCAAENLASKKAIEKAGFISEHRMVEVLLPRIDPTAGYTERLDL